jgi:hypothetical protein
MKEIYWKFTGSCCKYLVFVGVESDSPLLRQPEIGQFYHILILDLHGTLVEL